MTTTLRITIDIHSLGDIPAHQQSGITKALDHKIDLYLALHNKLKFAQKP